MKAVAAHAFPLARMSPLILTLTLGLFALPLLFLASAALGQAALVLPGALLVVLYAWVWLRFRPSRFVISPRSVEVRWPLKRRSIPRGEITSIRILDKAALRRELGWCVRVGVGGLWGGFGWLWTQRRGIVQMYISRTDGLVWIERVGHRPWLITPDDPARFIRALAA